MNSFFEFALRPRILYKPGLVREMSNEISGLNVQRAFIVADAGVERAGLLDTVRAGLGSSVELCGVYSDVPANSSVAAVEHGAALAREAGADLIIAVGGGSPIDTAKAIRILLTEGGNLLDYQGYNLLTRPLTPMIAIPTTAGTGSEVTAWAVIRDEANDLKIAFSSPFLGPDMAILDPELTLSLPPRLTAATGMDALTHAIESFVGLNANPITDTLGLQAIDMISNNLRAATHTGNDIEARGQMLIASCIAGIAFSGGGGSLGVVHALAHTIGGLYQVHHGTANAILLPYGMRFNMDTVPNRFSRIARAMGVNAGGRAEDEVIEDGIAAVEALLIDCNLPLRLRDVGVPRDNFEGMAETALGDPAIYTNPRTVTVLDALALLDLAW
ncbi:MAG: iron-containing alcohol dehydrogenase [Roseiflexaceae bacterium]|nr:iron-containing alcohol dehydrogenase [Roseiflexaceae bacterium]